MTKMQTQSLVPMASVADVERSIAFYHHLGFEVGNTFAPEGETKPSWAWLQSGNAQLMLSATNKPIPDKHTVLVYIYTQEALPQKSEINVGSGQYHLAVAGGPTVGFQNR